MPYLANRCLSTQNAATKPSISTANPNPPNRVALHAISEGVTPSVIAWSATLFGGFGFAVLMAGFVAAFWMDKRLFARYGMPEWLIELRGRLTVAVVLMLAATVVGANLRG